MKIWTVTSKARISNLQHLARESCKRTTHAPPPARVVALLIDRVPARCCCARVSVCCMLPRGRRRGRCGRCAVEASAHAAGAILRICSCRCLTQDYRKLFILYMHLARALSRAITLENCHQSKVVRRKHRDCFAAAAVARAPGAVYFTSAEQINAAGAPGARAGQHDAVETAARVSAAHVMQHAVALRVVGVALLAG
jgi:hypothetical protein